ncbi:DUF421 domain-containing protein [Alkalihalobacillus sp. AL-G]|uniref:DUF421 domain-containing protein n=1 Tax=Alkalihalobacillus sp. AL-G TaxID=2926399 RepID=UPI00272A43A0|nr:DUF421 domain-containing protein [Alkalihalobacillus sp. AL-G]WLD94970.1 DUF421 domain-containing protein [Alkalihalobacillus sp. AL-G]
MDILELSVELIIGFIGLFIVTRFLGKTQISQITPFDFISSLILGELLGNAIYDTNVSIFSILYAIVLWGLLIYVIEIWTQKQKGVRGMLEGQPAIVIHNGKILYPALKKSKLDINQLQALVRQKGYFSLYDVEYAILETNGTVSILPKSQMDIVNRQDLNLPIKQQSLPITLIIDREIVYDNLTELGKDVNWLKYQLQQQNIGDASAVLHAEWRIAEEQLLVTTHSSVGMK